MIAPALEPVDPRQCQAEIRVGGPLGFGRSRMARCKAEPEWIAVEVEPGEDGQRGGMSLCSSCREVLERTSPGCAFFLPLAALERA